MIALSSKEVCEDGSILGAAITLNTKAQMQALICHCSKIVIAFAEIQKICVEINAADVSIDNEENDRALSAIVEIEKNTMVLVVTTKSKRT